MCPSRRRLAGSWFVLPLLAAAPSGCIQQMADEGRIKPLEASTAFDNGMSAREPVPGTVARGQLRLDEAFFTGKVNGEYVAAIPQRALAGRSLEQLLSRGHERFGVYCSHCHGLVGGGTGGPPVYKQLVGMVVLRGFPSPPTFHQERLRAMPLGHFVDVITNGYGRMPAHGYLVNPDDRWSIAAYVRALQLSQHAPRNELPPAILEELDNTVASLP